MAIDPSTVCTIPHCGIIRIGGSAAGRFLHSQLSRDLSEPTPERALLAAWHDPRGRVRALFRVLQRSDDYLLLTDRSLVDSVCAELQKYVVGADVALLAMPDWTAHAVVDCTAEWLARHRIELASIPDTACVKDGLHWIRIGPQLVHCTGPAATLTELYGRDVNKPELAEFAEIGLVLPRITADMTGEFIPQMLNLDRLGAIAFDKGCYPGQEIIARTHNLGSVKRRAYVFECPTTDASVGSMLLNGSGETIGQVIRTGAREGRVRVLGVVQLDRLSAAIHLDDKERTELTRLRTPITDPLA